MNKCIHMCDHFRGCDGNWYISCSAFDRDKPSEECNEHCCEHETEEEEE